MADWRLYGRDVANRRLAEIKVYRSFSFKSVYNGIGTWSLDFPANFEYFGSQPFRAGIVVTRNGQTVFSGPVRSFEREEVYGRSHDMLVGGTDDTGSLERVRCLPVISGPPYTSAPADARTGPAETLMRGYVHDNAALGAHIQRRITGLVAGTSGGLGLTVDETARFDPLLAVLQRLAVKGVAAGANPLWFRVVQNSADPGILDLLVSPPVDRSRDIVFGFERRNLVSLTEREKAPRGGNYGIAGGKGEAEKQLIREWGESYSINRYGRHEYWLNLTQLNFAEELDAEIVAILEDSRPKSAVKVVVLDTPAAEAFVHYGLSDRVTVLRGIAATGLVREIEVSITPGKGAVVSPLIALDGGVAA